MLLWACRLIVAIERLTLEKICGRTDWKEIQNLWASPWARCLRKSSLEYERTRHRISSACREAGIQYVCV